MHGTRKRFLPALACGTALAFLGGCGVIIHDGGSMFAAVMTGGALFILGFSVVVFRGLRRIAELLSAIH